MNLRNLASELLWALRHQQREPYETLGYAIDVMLASLLPAARPDPSKVLVVRLDGIGDYLLWLPFAENLRQLYPTPRFHITLLTQTGAEPFVREFPWYDDLRSVDLRMLDLSLRYRRSVYYSLRRAGFGVAIHPTYSRTFRADALILATGARQRIGFAGDLTNISARMKRRSDGFYTRLVARPPEARMELEINAAFVRALGAAGVSAHRFRAPPLPPGEAIPAELAGDFLVVFPGAGWPAKRYPPERFAEVALRVHELTGWRVLVCGGPEDAALAESVCRSAAALPVQNLAGRLSVRQLMGLLAGARLLISNDTGVVHLAAGVGTPTVCLLGGGHYGRFLPYVEDDATLPAGPVPVIHSMDCFGCDWRCIFRLGPQDVAPCVAGISTGDVVAAARRLIGR